jgi:hypothetical protein
MVIYGSSDFRIPGFSVPHPFGRIDFPMGPAVRRFLRGNKCIFSGFYDLLPNMTGRNSREIGVFFVVASERCYFLGSYGVFWSDFLPMPVLHLENDEPFGVDFSSPLRSMSPAPRAKNSPDRGLPLRKPPRQSFPCRLRRVRCPVALIAAEHVQNRTEIIYISICISRAIVKRILEGGYPELQVEAR